MELQTTITEMKNTLEGINRRLGDTEEHMRNLEERIMKSPDHKQQKEKQTQGLLRQHQVL